MHIICIYPSLTSIYMCFFWICIYIYLKKWYIYILYLFNSCQPTSRTNANNLQPTAIRQPSSRTPPYSDGTAPRKRPSASEAPWPPRRLGASWAKAGWKIRQVQWIFLVPVKGGRDYIIPQKAIYKWYISGIYCQLGDYMLPTTF